MMTMMLMIEFNGTINWFVRLKLNSESVSLEDEKKYLNRSKCLGNSVSRGGEEVSWNLEPSFRVSGGVLC